MNKSAKIIIEPLMRDTTDITSQTIHVFCFWGIPKFIVRLYGNNEITLYNEKFKIINDVLSVNDKKRESKADDLIKQSYVLSQKLSSQFNFVRVDWMVCKNKLYFEELTFTPHSGFLPFYGNWNLILGNLLDLERI